MVRKGYFRVSRELYTLDFIKKLPPIKVTTVDWGIALTLYCECDVFREIEDGANVPEYEIIEQVDLYQPFTFKEKVKEKGTIKTIPPYPVPFVDMARELNLSELEPGVIARMVDRVVEADVLRRQTHMVSTPNISPNLDFFRQQFMQNPTPYSRRLRSESLGILGRVTE